MTSTSTSTITDSISSLSSSSPSRAPSISRIYKQASQLFLTRQLAEAWEVLTPLVNPEYSLSQSDGGFGLGNGSSENENRSSSNGDPSYDHSLIQAPHQSQMASASKSARVKVWGLWLALVHELLQLGSEEGAKVLQQLDSRQDARSGAKKWKEVTRKVQEGEIWEDVVRVGYLGNEGAVDGEVVANLATLLLSHAQTQTLTQARLETYLSSTSSGPSPSQLASRLESSSPSKSNGQTQHQHSTHNGTSTPADLNTRLKLLEIYTLHVLPRNQEWDYARDFINMSELLDEDKREAFLAALGSLREESDIASRAEGELQKRRQIEEEEVKRRKGEEQKRRAEEERNRKTAAEMGLGRSKEKAAETPSPKQADGGAAAPTSKPTSAAISASAAASRRTPSTEQAKKPVSSSKPVKRQASNFLERASHTLAALQQVLLQVGTSITRNPMVLLRFLFFIVALVFALGRRDVRDRVGKAWEKIKGTVGMGVKTTYL